MEIPMEQWQHLREGKRRRLERARQIAPSKIVRHEQTVDLLQAVIEKGDRVCIEGDNQKQADFLAAALARCDAGAVSDLHMIMSSISLPEHIALFEKGIARTVDFCYSAREGARLASLVANRKISIGAIHTYPELYARYFMDLTPHVSLICADAADGAGNLYTGFNTEDTAVIAEATAFRNGVLIAQVNEIVDALPRTDIPGDWVDFVVKSPSPYSITPLFTRDPADLNEIKILMAMMVIKGIYAPYGVRYLNHGIGYNTAAIELLLPTYGEALGLKGSICTHWMLNPHPTLIPAIESGFVQAVYCPGSEVGMEEYIRARPDIFFTGHDGSMRSNRCLAHLAGHYALDLFIGSTLQIDTRGNSSTATVGRIAGFGGAPNLGCDARGRRHGSPAWLKAGQEQARYAKRSLPRGRKLVVQIVETFQERGTPTFVEELDAVKLMRDMGQEIPPVMVYGDDVTHIVTEEGIANLLLCRNEEERIQAVRGVAGYTPAGLRRSAAAVGNLIARGVITRPQDLGIRWSDASTDLLAARSVRELVEWSKGLYRPPRQFIRW
ncbi:MAG: malonate decarboxylase subunit alpha [Candidatus Aureabacteria bacterium]|nr:malonate decarboxylase subunit alpha [Candidatus Auribacterota bacterium]